LSGRYSVCILEILKIASHEDHSLRNMLSVSTIGVDRITFRGDTRIFRRDRDRLRASSKGAGAKVSSLAAKFSVFDLFACFYKRRCKDLTNKNVLLSSHSTMNYDSTETSPRSVVLYDSELISRSDFSWGSFSSKVAISAHIDVSFSGSNLILFSVRQEIHCHEQWLLAPKISTCCVL
jgi:hypothetical protein